MYTWGYIVQSTLAKLDLEEDEANQQGLLDRFKIYANEAISQISSSIKPDWKYAHFRIWENEQCAERELINEGKTQSEIEDILSKRPYVNELHNMPIDFISFGNNVNKMKVKDVCTGSYVDAEMYDTDVSFIGRRVKFLHPGEFEISYNAKWKIGDFYSFMEGVNESTELDIPDDILNCLPSYIASQCYKMDDEVKSSIYRNEYELFLSRIDATDYSNTRTFTIGGNW